MCSALLSVLSLSSVEQAFVGREEIRAPLKTPAWEATGGPEQPTLITTVFTHEIRIEIPTCFGADVGDMIFQSLECLQVLR